MQAKHFIWMLLCASVALTLGTASILILLTATIKYSNSLLDVVGFGLSVSAIVIGLIITYYQNKQGDKIDNQGREITGIVSQISRQGNRMEAILNEVRTMNSEVRAMIAEARAREDRRKNFRLPFIRAQTTQLEIG